MINPWLILGVVLAILAAAGGGYYKGNEAGMAEVQQQWDAEKTRLAEQHAKDQQAAREKEQELQAAADQLRQEKDRELREVNARATALAHSLRQRPERAAAPSGAPAAAGAGQSGSRCTGAELPREDASFLAGEAARADQLRAALAQCYAQYEKVRGQ